MRLRYRVTASVRLSKESLPNGVNIEVGDAYPPAIVAVLNEKRLGEGGAERCDRAVLGYARLWLSPHILRVDHEVRDISEPR